MTKTIVILGITTLIIALGAFTFHADQGVIECTHCSLEYEFTYQVTWDEDTQVAQVEDTQAPPAAAGDESPPEEDEDPQPIATFPPGSEDDCPIGTKCIWTPPPVK